MKMEIIYDFLFLDTENKTEKKSKYTEQKIYTTILCLLYGKSEYKNDLILYFVYWFVEQMPLWFHFTIFITVIIRNSILQHWVRKGVIIVWVWIYTDARATYNPSVNVRPSSAVRD